MAPVSGRRSSGSVISLVKGGVIIGDNEGAHQFKGKVENEATHYSSEKRANATKPGSISAARRLYE